MSRTRRLLKKLLLSCASLGLAVAAAELICRAQEPGPFSFFDHQPYVDSPADLHVRHVPGFTGRWDATWYEIDSRGFRGPERVPTFAEGELRIACLGDSTTFGKGVLEPDTWPRILERELRAEGRNALAFNMGINGAHGRVYRQVLTEHLDELKPNLVVVGYNINDFPNSIKAVNEKVFEQRKLRRVMPQGLRDGLGRLALYRKLRAVYYDTQKARDWAAAEATAKGAANEPLDSAVWELQREYLSGIQALAAQHGGRVMVFLFPYESQVYLDSFDTTPIERLSELCASLDLPFFDVAGEFRAVARATTPPARLFLAGDRFHPNAVGYEIVAERVLTRLRELGWLPAL
ncbi:MAG: SGNH/GDSL hydrolase family protein [Planctomycetota bacterium]